MTTPVPVPTPAGLEPAFDLAAYYPVLIYAAVVVGMAVAIVGASHVPFLKPRKPTPVKQMPYESGMDPIGDARQQFDVKFYLVAILFLVFDVELLFLYPWAVIAYGEGGDPAWRQRSARSCSGRSWCSSPPSSSPTSTPGGRGCSNGGERARRRLHDRPARLRSPTGSARTASGRCRSPPPAAASS